MAITSFIEEDRITAALEAGASGFLLKDAEADDLAARHPLGPRRRGLPRSGRGRHRRPPDARRRGRRAGGERAGRAGLDQLTARERDVLACLARGLSNRAIAEELGMAERTARTHVSNILAKLGLTSRTQAALFAVDHRADLVP